MKCDNIDRPFYRKNIPPNCLLIFQLASQLAIKIVYGAITPIYRTYAIITTSIHNDFKEQYNKNNFCFKTKELIYSNCFHYIILPHSNKVLISVPEFVTLTHHHNKHASILTIQSTIFHLLPYFIRYTIIIQNNRDTYNVCFILLKVIVQVFICYLAQILTFNKV